ncbi:hypothetical protein N0754_18855 [Pseudomonas aeruginosa]|nr:hypothetical protein [Pseudomonas aeruginosa]MCS9764297.1 hypothetical protein [Pseudomonas aeruginosa]MCS9820473.1 hypothetical protein [Pseudomonas aeruginosa]MCT0241054.1 hypothetical protein [Pseudomonas aeruginosa]MCT0528507.1 hypothetical protein [Pseudomonas aeruginosa]
MTNIVSTWLQCLEGSGKGPTEASRGLQEALGMAVTVSRLREWEDGRRGLPDKAYNHMLKGVLPRCLAFLQEASGDASPQEQAAQLFTLIRQPVKTQAPQLRKQQKAE